MLNLIPNGLTVINSPYLEGGENLKEFLQGGFIKVNSAAQINGEL
jgi:hypothetical protein